MHLNLFFGRNYKAIFPPPRYTDGENSKECGFEIWSGQRNLPAESPPVFGTIPAPLLDLFPVSTCCDFSSSKKSAGISNPHKGDGLIMHFRRVV